MPVADGPTRSVVEVDPHATTGGDGSPTIAKPLPESTGRYELRDEIARGGMGVIYRATDTTFGREVAIKVLSETFGPASGAARRFLDEARITGQLQHPAIPPVHDLGTLPDGRPFLAMKLIKGQTLDELLKDRTDLSVERGRFVAAFEQVCQGMAYAHAHKVIHRDLKPANVMVGNFGEVQVMDWGLAKILSGREREQLDDPVETASATSVKSLRDSDGSLTQAGSILGTPAFMPPEQALGAISKIDTRSDVFGLGAVLAVILTGKPPFAASSVETTRIQAAQGKMDDCFARLDACGADPGLVALAKRCLSPTPADRPADAGEVAKDVAELRQAADERARRAELDRVRSEERRKRRKVQMTLAASAFGLLVAAVFGVTVAQLWRSAERAKVTAESAQGDAEAARERLARVEYGRTIQVAYREWLDDNAGATVQLLASTRPDLRGWEYRYLYGLCNTSLLTLKGPMDRVFSAEFSPDGARVLISGWDTKLNGISAQVRDANTGAELLTLNVSGFVTGMAFNSDGTRIVAVGSTSVQIWDAWTGAEVFARTLGTNERGPKGFDSSYLTPDGTKFVRRSANGPFCLWDIRTGADLVVLEGTKARPPTGAMAFSADGSRVVAVGAGDPLPTDSPDTGSGTLTIGSPAATKTVRVWDTKTGAALLDVTGKEIDVWSATFSPDGSRLLVTGRNGTARNGTARVWDAKTGKELLALNGHRRTVNSGSFSRDGSRIATPSSDGTTRIWDAKTGNELLVLKGHTDEVYSATFSPDGTRLVTSSEDGTARVWDARNGAELPQIKGPAGVILSRAIVSPEGMRVVTAGEDMMIRVWDARTGAELRAWPMNKDGGRLTFPSVAFIRDGTRIVTCSEEGTVRVWDTITGAEFPSLKSSAGGLVMVSPNGARIATSSFSAPRGVVDDFRCKVQVWDANSGAEVCVLASTTETCPAFSPDGTRLVTTSDDGSTRVWDASSGSELLVMKAPDDGGKSPITGATFSPDGSRVVTGGPVARIWDARTGAELVALKGTRGFMYSASFSPDGTRIVTGDTDANVRVWDATSGVELMSFKWHNEAMTLTSNGPAFSTDGEYIVTGDSGGTVRLWGVRKLPFAPPPKTAPRGER